MGNCTGVFSTCCGQEGETIKKIDRDNMQKALSQNQAEYHNAHFEGGQKA